jgi:hypothetical protein
MGLLKMLALSPLVAVVVLMNAVWKVRPVHGLAVTGKAYSAFDLLAADQYSAQSRRSEEERLLLYPDGKAFVELEEPVFDKKKSRGTKEASSSVGFGGGADKRWSKSKALAQDQKHCLLDTGVVRINGALSTETCAALRQHVLEEVESTAALYQEALTGATNVNFNVEDYYGIEPGRTCRTDLLLSMTAPSVATALHQLFHAKTGKLRALYESLVTTDGTFYELASVVTSTGSDRQCIHPDVPFQSTAPLYVVFLALQDVTQAMGPTTFLSGSHTQAANRAFDNKGDEFDSLLSNAQPVESCLSTGDLVVFDARVLHCGNANLDENQQRALFNFSFRDPSVFGDMGYKGSMRPGYTRQDITLGDFLTAVDSTKKKTEAAATFAQFGNGWGMPQ